MNLSVSKFFRFSCSIFLSYLFMNVGSLQAATPFKVLSFNVGTAHEEDFHADCPNFKLCHKEAIQRIQTLVTQAQPDVILFQETQGPDQLFGTAFNGPVLDSLAYDGRCTKGVSGVQEVCVAWRRATFKPIGETDIACTALSNTISNVDRMVPNGGGVQSCSLQSVDGSIARVDVISVHGNTDGDYTRFEMLDTMWKHVVDSGTAVVVGGDINTPSCTSGEADCSHPAPPSFGTVYGFHLQGYGIWNPNDSFYGQYALDSSGVAKSEGSHSTHYLRRLDHVFANFGAAPARPVDESQAIAHACEAGKPWGTRVPFDGGLTIFSGGMGWQTDHYPILSCLSI